MVASTAELHFYDYDCIMAPGSRKTFSSSASTNTARINPSHSAIVQIPSLNPSIPATQSSCIDACTLRRVRGPTVGKRLRKNIAHCGRRLDVYVKPEMRAFGGINATKLANELGTQIRRMCTGGFVHSWKKVDPVVKEAVIQAVRDKFRMLEDGVEYTDLVHETINVKASMLYKDWKHTMGRHYDRIRAKDDDPYHNPYRGVNMDDWKYIIDHIFTDHSWKVRKESGKKNRAALPYGSTLGSRSYTGVITQHADRYDGEVPNFCLTYEITHKLKATGDWINPVCKELYDKMVNLQDDAVLSGTPLSSEELSRSVLGERKYYILGLGKGPRPSSYSATCTSSSAHQKELHSVRSELETLREEAKQRDEQQQKQREEEKKQMEEEKRQMEEVIRQIQEEKRQTEEAAQRRHDALQKEMDELRSLMRAMLDSGHH